MTLTFLTNFINHHQVPIAEEYYKALGSGYTFVANEPLPESFEKSGYPDYDKPYLLKAYESKENMAKAKKLIAESEVVVIGQFPYSMIRQRILDNKLTFCDDERWFKEYLKDCWMNYKYWFRPLYKFYQHTFYRNKNYFLLCASAYTAKDAHVVGAFPNKCYRWGYFTVVPSIDINSIIEKKREKIVKILWVGRFIDWKHPELMLKLAFFLKQKGYRFHINMQGAGYLHDEIANKAKQSGLSDVLTVGGSLPNAEILHLMQSHHIYCFTSDKNEGWGAVLNEAMANGCCPVASDSIGSAPYLIQNGKNGILYKNAKFISLCEKVEWLINHTAERELMSIEAYQTMATLWNAKNASHNFLTLAQAKLEGNGCVIMEGPCSPAPIKN